MDNNLIPLPHETPTPADVLRAIGLMQAAGFVGTHNYNVEAVTYPGGAYELRTVTFVSRDKAVRETYMADLFAKYPMITITEAARIGLLGR